VVTASRLAYLVDAAGDTPLREVKSH
jgi:hypothetical protein